MRRPDPRGPLVLLGNLVLALFFSALAIGFTIEGVREDSPSLWVGALVLVAPIALVVWVALVGNLLQHRFPRGLPAPRATTYDGERGVEVPEWSFGRRVVPPIVVVGAVSGLGLGVGALASGRPAFAVAGLAAGVAGCWVLWQLARGTIGFAGGVVLTPTRIVHRWGPQRASVAWGDVREVDGRGLRSPYPDDVMVLTHPGAVVRTGVKNGAPGGANGPDKDWVELDTRCYGLPPAGLAEVISTYARRPELREELADERGLQRVTAAAHDVVRRRVAR